MSAKYKLLAELIRADLLQNSPPGSKLPTEAQLVDRYQMSRQTVRHALGILAEEGQIQRRQGSGSYIPQKSQKNDAKQIAIILSFPDDYIYPSILRDAQSVFLQQGYPVTVYATENNVCTERSILLALLNQNIRAILVEGTKTALPTPNDDLYRKLQQSGVCILFLHSKCDNLRQFPCIARDNFNGGYQLAQHLIGQGHLAIAGIFQSDDQQGLQRYHGAVSALRDAGLPILDHAFCWYDTQEGREMVNKQDQRLMDRFLERLTDSTAVICYNDEIANALIRALLSRGMRVPEDMAVVSFDNSYYSQLCPVSITSLAPKAPPIGLLAAQQLIALINVVSVPSQTLGWTRIDRSSG